MAEFGEWARKGAALTIETACKEYGLEPEFVLQGIRNGKLEFREVSMWGNPTYKILRSQCELLVIECLGAETLRDLKISSELAEIDGEIVSLKRKVSALEKRKLKLQTGIKS